MDFAFSGISLMTFAMLGAVAGFAWWNARATAADLAARRAEKARMAAIPAE